MVLRYLERIATLGRMRPTVPIGNPPITPEWLGIWFKPMGDEPSLERLEVVTREGLAPWHIVSQDAGVDPMKLARELKVAQAERGGEKFVYVFVPGRVFDAFGTRHGRGGGWYDRFLAALPASWLKIGVCSSLQWSEVELERKAWDVSMDWIIRT